MLEKKTGGKKREMRGGGESGMSCLVESGGKEGKKRNEVGSEMGEALEAGRDREE